MFAAFLGGWEIVLLLVVFGGVGVLLIATLLVVFLVNLKKLRGDRQSPPAPPVGS
jgi:hypothetical protein